jgi:hypothetical protein
MHEAFLREREWLLTHLTMLHFRGGFAADEEAAAHASQLIVDRFENAVIACWEAEAEVALQEP